MCIRDRTKSDHNTAILEKLLNNFGFNATKKNDGNKIKIVRTNTNK